MDRARRDQMIDQCAQALRRWRMVTPALMFLESHRPLSFIASQLMLVAEPAMSLIMPVDGPRELSRLLEDPEGISLLVDALEERG